MVRFAIVGAVAACLLAVSCSFNEPRIRSEPVILQPQTDSQVPLAANDPSPWLNMQCQEKTSWYTRLLGQAVGGTAGNECVYEVVTEDSLHAALLSPNKQVRDNAVLTVLYLSDRSCDNFRAKVFAFRTSATFASGFLNSILSGTGAIASLANGPAGAGLAAANLASGNALNGINSSYYANKMIDQLDAEMEAQRAQKKAQILARVQATGSDDESASQTVAGNGEPTATPTAGVRPYTGVDAEIELQSYDNLCSLETLTRPSVSPSATATGTATPTATPTPILKVSADPSTLEAKFSSAAAIPKSGTISIENPKASGIDVTVTDVTVTAADGTNGGFVIPPPLNCTKKFTAGDPVCKENVTFTPTTLKNVQVRVKIKSDAPGTPATTDLVGKIQNGLLTPDKVSLTVSQGVPAILTLTNNDPDLATIKILNVSKQPPALSFSVAGFPVGVNKGSAIPLTVSYNGGAPSKGKLRIKLDSSNKDLVIPVQGR